MARVDRALVIDLLGDATLSYREIARRACCSDWSVREIAKQLEDEPPASHHSVEGEPLGLGAWLFIGGAAIAVIWLCVVAARQNPGDWPPFPENGPMQ